jgi:hypothetical protein
MALRSRRGLLVSAMLSRRSHVRHRLQYGTALVAVAVGLYAGFLWMLPQPRTWVTLKTTAEFLRFKAIKPDLTAFHAVGMWAVSLDDKDELNGCVDAVVTPGQDARVEYRRGGDDFFRIIVDPPKQGEPSLLLQEKSKGYAAKSVAGNVVFTANDDCDGDAPKRLPIWGPTEFGEELKPAGPAGEIAPGMLINGTIEVYAHAQERLIGISFPASVYSVMTFDLPPGSVLRSGIPSEDEGTWTGAAIVSAHGTGFDVEATSNTPSVVLRSSRTFGMSKTASRRIDLGHYAQFMKDPNILWIQLLGGTFLVLMRLVLSIVSFFTEDAGVNSEAPEQKNTVSPNDGSSPRPPTPS